MKRIIVLGGSYMQLGLIEKACEMGFEVTVLDRNEGCIASKLDGINFYPIDILKVKEVDNFLSNKTFDAAIAPISEIGNITLSKLAKKHSFIYNSEVSVKRTTEKKEMRAALALENNHKYYSYLEIKNDLKNVKYPLIVKPSKSSASRGVTLVRKKDNLESAIKYGLEYCSEEDLLIEEFFEGKQYSVETISQNGKHNIIAIVEERMSEAPYFVERTDILECESQEYLKDLVYPFMKNVLDKLEIKVGPCHTEIKINDNNEIFLVEVASRSGLLRDRIIRLSGGTDYDELIIKSYLGEEIEFSKIKTPQKTIALNILMEPNDLNFYLLSKKHDLIVDEYFYPKGPEINPIRLTDAFGYYFIQDMGTLNNYCILKK